MGVIESIDESARANRYGLVARCVSMTIGEKSLLKGLSLQVRPGEVLAVVGPNGAGKSTLLKVLSGEYRPDFGSISLNGRELRDISLKKLAHQRAVLPKETQLSFPFRAEEVVAMGRSPFRQIDHQSEEHIVRQAMDVAGVKHLFGRNYTTLSGGERQRVQLARVLAQVWEAGDEPRYLLLDEPTSALDLAHQHKVLETATKFALKSNMGVLAVLHDLNLAAYYADRIAMLKNGYLLCCGTPTEVLTTDRIEEAFELSAVVLEHPQCKNCPLVVASVGTDEKRHRIRANLEE